MEFKKYQHIERLGTQSVDKIMDGYCIIQPKIDGTNASVWVDDGVVKCGSRNRELTQENDNAGFCKFVDENVKLQEFMLDNPNIRLYGEWLVKHTIKTYKDEAWRNFYVFDVTIKNGQNDDETYLEYEQYKEDLDDAGIVTIPVIGTLQTLLTYQEKKQEIEKLIESNTYLIDTEKYPDAIGEGIVIKNYSFRNRYGHTVWAKIVRNEFKEEKGTKTKKQPSWSGIEKDIVEVFVTKAFVEKEKAKIELENDGWHSKFIPMLLGKIQYEIITEEMCNILEKFKNPTINFKFFKKEIVEQTKTLLPEVF